VAQVCFYLATGRKRAKARQGSGSSLGLVVWRGTTTKRGKLAESFDSDPPLRGLLENVRGRHYLGIIIECNWRTARGETGKKQSYLKSVKGRSRAFGSTYDVPTGGGLKKCQTMTRLAENNDVSEGIRGGPIFRARRLRRRGGKREGEKGVQTTFRFRLIVDSSPLKSANGLQVIVGVTKKRFSK